jgi:hypothetical protein
MQVQQAKNATEADLMRERAFVDQVPTPSIALICTTSRRIPASAVTD